MLTPGTHRGICPLCVQPVKAGQDACFAVEGWEIERHGGGANQILDRQRVTTKSGQVIGHRACVQAAAARRRRGISPDQATFDVGG